MSFDLKANGENDPVVGVYEIAETMTEVGGEFGFFTRERVAAELEERVAAGEADADGAAEELAVFDGRVEFTADGRVVEWMKIPAGVSEEEIKEAVEAGEIAGCRDGLLTTGETKEWKTVEGRYYYNSGGERELFGEEQSPWDELTFDENGLLIFGGVMKLRRI
ncbi:MAG: hypothetical protein IJU94_06795 [Clostridia bacterium]|nr:hypothetical protein [Clostridia bacterium]